MKSLTVLITASLTIVSPIVFADSTSNVEKTISKQEFSTLFPLTDGAQLLKSYTQAKYEVDAKKKEIAKAQIECDEYTQKKDWVGLDKCIAAKVPGYQKSLDNLTRLTGELQNCPAINVIGTDDKKVDFSGEAPDPSKIKSITTSYTYENLVATAKAFPEFLNSKNPTTNKRELGAFLANANQETLGFCFTSETPFDILEKINNEQDVKSYGKRMMDWLSKEDQAELKTGKIIKDNKQIGTQPYIVDTFGKTWDQLSEADKTNLAQWFFKYKKPRGKYCGNEDWCNNQNSQYYYGRGSIQLSYPSNYKKFSDAMNNTHQFGSLDLVANPSDVVALKHNTPTGNSLIWASGIWFWMTPQYNKPSSHAVMNGSWVPTSADLQNGRKPGFGTTINVINGGLECGVAYERAGPDADVRKKVQNRIDRYNSLLKSMLGSSYKEDEATHPTACGKSNSFNCTGDNVGKTDECPIRDSSVKPDDQKGKVDCVKQPSDITYQNLALNICKIKTGQSSGTVFDNCYNHTLAWGTGGNKNCDVFHGQATEYGNCMRKEIYATYCKAQ